MRDHEYLDLTIIPKLNLYSFRFFLPHERHMERICKDDVLLLILDGVLRFEEDGREVELHKGEWYIQHAGGHQTGLRESDSPSYFYIHFFGTYTQRKNNTLALRGNFDVQRITPLLTMLDQSTEHLHGMLDKYIYFLRILTLLIDSESHSTPNASLCVEIAEYIDQHFNESLSLDDMAQHFSYSKDHIIRVFKRYYGLTPYKYLTLIRIDHAKRLLNSTNRYIVDIACDCGFNDVTSFYRAFTQNTGLSPAEWQEQHSSVSPGMQKRRRRRQST